MPWPFLFGPGLAKLGMNSDNIESESECTEEQENSPAGESENQRPKRRKDKSIRLDDLIPKQDVKGGNQLLFGVADTTETTTKEN